LNTNPEDSSPSSPNQRPYDEVYQTPRLRSADSSPYRHARVAASRSLRENDGNRQRLSDIQDLSLPTPCDGNPTTGNAVERCQASGSQRSSSRRIVALMVTTGRKRLASEHRFDFEGAGIPPQFRRIAPSIFPQRGADAAFHPRDTVKEVGILSQRCTVRPAHAHFSHNGRAPHDDPQHRVGFRAVS
jgi:hypothetical protein